MVKDCVAVERPTPGQLDHLEPERVAVRAHGPGRMPQPAAPLQRCATNRPSLAASQKKALSSVNSGAGRRGGGPTASWKLLRLSSPPTSLPDRFIVTSMTSLFNPSVGAGASRQVAAGRVSDRVPTQWHSRRRSPSRSHRPDGGDCPCLRCRAASAGSPGSLRFWSFRPQ